VHRPVSVCFAAVLDEHGSDEWANGGVSQACGWKDDTAGRLFGTDGALDGCGCQEFSPPAATVSIRCVAAVAGRAGAGVSGRTARGQGSEARTGMGIGGNGNVAVQFQVTSTVESFSGRSAGGAD
jgi:hypothetical protein